MLTPSRGTPPTTEDEIDKPKEPEKPEYTLVNSLLTFTMSEVGSKSIQYTGGLFVNMWQERGNYTSELSVSIH